MRFKLTGRSIFLLLIILIALHVSSPVRAKDPIVIYDPSPSPSMPLPIIGYSPPIVPVSGVIRVLVIAVAFPDVNNTLSIAQLKKNWFGIVPAYYHEISFGKLTIQGDVFGWYKLPYPKDHYAKNCHAINDADCSKTNQSYHIVDDVVRIAQKDVNFSNYDYYVFVHSGTGQESTHINDDVWSVTYMDDISIKTNSKALTRFNIIPEREAPGTVPNGVWCLEFAHNLGLPDLYNTNNGKTILGPWELMDKGSWNGHPGGSSPAHMIAWDKIELGFISGHMIATVYPGVNSTFTIDPTEIASTNVHVLKIMPTIAANQSQYYLVEVRTKTGFDSALPAEGVLITYVNENLLVGSVQVINSHPKITTLEGAVWTTGQTFTDSTHKLSVKVDGKIGNAYQVTVAPPTP